MTNANSSAQRTLILVKPDGVRRGLVGEVIARVERKGYKISALRMLTADKSMLESHYAEHNGKPFYEPLMEFMLSGPIVALIAEYSTDNGTTWVTPSPISEANPLRIINLAESTTYQVKMRAVNLQGAGCPSLPVPATMTTIS